MQSVQREGHLSNPPRWVATRQSLPSPSRSMAPFSPVVATQRESISRYPDQKALSAKKLLLLLQALEGAGRRRAGATGPALRTGVRGATVRAWPSTLPCHHIDVV